MLWDTWQGLQKNFLLFQGEASLAKKHNRASKTPFPMHSTARKADMVLENFAFDNMQSENPTDSQKA